MKIGRPVFRQMAEAAPDYVSSDCAIAGRHILQGMGATTQRKAASDHVDTHCLWIMNRVGRGSWILGRARST